MKLTALIESTDFVEYLGQQVPVMIDPTPNELIGALQRYSEGFGRGLRVGFQEGGQPQKIVVWNGYDATHAAMIEIVHYQWDDYASEELEFRLTKPKGSQRHWYQAGPIWVCGGIQGTSLERLLSMQPVSESSSNIDQFFLAAENITRNEGIEAAEQMWSGGVGDFGDKDAGYQIQAMPGFFDYQSEIEVLADRYLGAQFTCWRWAVPEQLEDWQAGADIGPISVSLSRGVAERFGNLAMNKGKKGLLLEITVTPADIIMIGHPGEYELVVDSSMIEPSSRARVIKTLGEAQEQIEIVNKFSQRRVEVNVLVDPTPAELMGFLKRTSHGICRAVYTRRPQYQQYVWDAYLANHDEMLRTLREQWGVDIGSDPMQLEYSTVDPETDQIGILNGEFYQMGSIWVTYAPPFLRSRFAKSLGKMASGALTESQHRPLQQMIADFRAGYVYHGTTQVQAELILDHGFRIPSFDQLVQEVATKMAMKVTPKIMDQLRDERRYYERDGQPMVSTAFSPEIAGRWAGSGGETIKQIEQVLSGRRLNWGHPDSSFSGPKTVLRVHLNEAGRKMPAYLRMSETVDRVEQLMVSGKYDEEDGWDTLANTYFDIRIQPDQIDHVEIVE